MKKSVILSLFIMLSSAVLTALAITVMICIFFIDLEHLIIFNRFSIALALLGVGCIFTDPYTVWYDHLIGALAGALLFLLIYFGAILVLKKEMRQIMQLFTLLF